MSNPTLLYTIVDAFTSTPFSGNPASVIILPPASYSLSTESLLQIAAEFNLSETAFLIPQTSNSPGTLRYGLRWFTPTVEMPICGHATLASARVIFSTPEGQQVDRLEFDTLSGTLVAKKVPGGSGKIELDLPASTLKELSSEDELAQVLEVVSAAAGRSVSVREARNAGFYLLVELDPSFDLEGAVLDTDQFEFGFPSKNLTRLTLLFVQRKLPFDAVILTSSRQTSFRPSARFISRVLAPLSGIAEDPVCGSAHCVLVPYWSRVLGIPPGEIIETRQVSKRGGDLDLIWEKESGRVRIQGSAIVTMRGELYL
ncbi:hypothetical protein FRC00_008239 [Tulasnella sp. 408]|nr:hypothetical protein FRC00_008239 [Tulasnella sp. 408]